MVGPSGRQRTRRLCELKLRYNMWVDESSCLKDTGVVDVEPVKPDSHGHS